MKKIPCLFKRTFERNSLVYNEVNDGCQWVLDGEGIATRKFDGTACLVRDEQLFKRYDAKRGKTPPANFEPCGEPDEVTGHHPGWVPVVEGDPASQWHWQAWVNQRNFVNDGTYELCGPKLQSHPEWEYVSKEQPNDPTMHILIPHGKYLMLCPRSFDSLKVWLENQLIEGIVFHHPDGRMCKIRRKDFGHQWPIPRPGATP